MFDQNPAQSFPANRRRPLHWYYYTTTLESTVSITTAFRFHLTVIFFQTLLQVRPVGLQKRKKDLELPVWDFDRPDALPVIQLTLSVLMEVDSSRMKLWISDGRTAIAWCHGCGYLSIISLFAVVLDCAHSCCETIACCCGVCELWLLASLFQQHM